MARQVLENGVILPAEYSDDWYDDMTSNLTKLDDVIGSDSEKLSSADVGAAALSNNYNDLDNLPTIPTVNDATLTIQKNGVDVQTFTANASSNVTCNITVPTKTSDLTNDSNFVDTSNSAVASGITSAKVTDYDTHIADTDIHVTTADKTKWNNNVNQSYVFRYSGTAITNNSTIAYSTIDNTDNIKAGDKILDVDGKIFSVVSVDSDNSTVTVGTALIDLANDSDVVHRSGDETVGGEKTFSSNVNVYNSDSATDTANIVLKNSKAERGVESPEQSINFIDKNNNLLAKINCNIDNINCTRLYITVYDINNNSDGFFLRRTTSGTSIIPTTSAAVSLGNTSAPFFSVQTKKINTLEPSSLSLPSGNASDVIDISSYLVNLDGTTNTYTAPANGWISIVMNNSSGIQGFINGLWGHQVFRPSAGAVRFLMPILKNLTANIAISGGTIGNARFIPCQGNI